MSSPFNLEAIGDPLFEAVSVTDLKKHLRVSHSADDTYIGLLSVAARQQVEKDFNVALVGQNYDLHLEHGFYHFYHRFCGFNLGGFPLFNSLNLVTYYPRLELPILPVSKDYPVTISYTDQNGSPQTFNAANYVVKYWKDPPEIMLLPGVEVPSIQAGSDVVVNFTAGYVTTDEVSTVPTLYKQAIQLLVSAWYENREGVSEALVRSVPLSYERIKAIAGIKRFK